MFCQSELLESPMEPILFTDSCSKVGLRGILYQICQSKINQRERIHSWRVANTHTKKQNFKNYLEDYAIVAVW